jgi:monoamine oxidase
MSRRRHDRAVRPRRADDTDVAIIGAGAAGLAAARALSQAGRRVMVIEARSRLGGRILTVHAHDWPLPIELGAEFVHGAAPDTRQVARAAGLPLVDLFDVHLWSDRDGWRSAGEVWAQLGAALRRRIPGRGRDVPFASVLARPLPPRVRELATGFVEGYFAAHLDRVSAQWLRSSFEDDHAARQSRLPGGYDAVLRWLRAGLDPERVELRLGAAVTDVRWRRGEVEIGTRSPLGSRGTPVRARAAIVTLPLGVLKAPAGTPGAVRFTPPLLRQERALGQLEVGQVCKLSLRFREPFWEEEGFLEQRLAAGQRTDAGQIDFLHDPHGPFPTWWLTRPLRAPVLTAWAGGPRAEALLSLDQRARVARSLDGLGALMRLDRRWLESRLEAWQEHDWRADACSRGAYSYVAAGGRTAPRRLAEPVEGTLFFAGEATEADEMGTVSGALASGRRAASRILE